MLDLDLTKNLAQTLSILNVKNPNKPYIVQQIKLGANYYFGETAFVVNTKENEIKIMLFGGDIDGKICTKFCEVTVYLNTLRYSINNNPNIQQHFAAANIIDTIDNNGILIFRRYLWYKNRYLIVFAYNIENVLCYDALCGIWHECKCKIPMNIQSLHKPILILKTHQSSNKYLHFIDGKSHVQLNLGENKLREDLWQIERLLWIAYFKNQINVQYVQQQMQNQICPQRLCWIGAVPKDIIKYILLFLEHNNQLYFLHGNTSNSISNCNKQQTTAFHEYNFVVERNYWKYSLLFAIIIVILSCCVSNVRL